MEQETVVDIKALEKKLREASDAYYNSDEIKLSDGDFDSLKSQLEELDPNNAFLKEIGAVPTGEDLGKVAHVIPMGSLKKVKSLDELGPFLDSLPDAKTTLIVQPKYDGCSIELVYKNGKLVQGVTRGDGMEGEDITHTVTKMAIPQTIYRKEDIYIRGELIIGISNWSTYLSTTTQNPRNACAGIMRRKDNASVVPYLSFMAFDIYSPTIVFRSEVEKLNLIGQQYMSTVQYEACNLLTLKTVIERFTYAKNTAPMEWDGLVIKVNDTKIQKELGEHDGYPYWAKAYKWASESANTILTGVQWTVGSNGALSPVGIVDGVRIGGVTVTRVSLHNVDEIARLGLKIGDAVELIRANDVIPKIVRVVKTSPKNKVITCDKCPVCNSEAVKKGPFLYCTNKTKCAGVDNKRIMKWMQKRNIMHMGPASVSQITANIMIEGIADFYNLTELMLVNCGLGQGEAVRLIKQLETSRFCTVTEMIGCLSIDMLGRREADNIAELLKLKTVEDWKNLKVEDLAGKDGFKDVLAKRIVGGIQDNIKLIDSVAKEMKFIGTIKSSPTATSTNKGPKLFGLSFCFTGKMMGTRMEMEHLVTSNGGTVDSAVKAGLSYLVAASTTSSKAQTARRLGVNVISEIDFMKMIV